MNFDNILDDLSPFTSIPKELKKQWILECLQDMCMETWLHHEWLTFLTTAGTAEYTLSPSDAASKVIGIFKDGVEFSVVDTPEPSASDGTTVGALAAGTTYTYRVSSYINEYGETLPCAAVARVCPATGSILLTWDAVDDADGYKIYRLSGATYYYLASTTSVTYEDTGATALSSTQMPSKSTAVKQIVLSNENYEKWSDQHWRFREGDTVESILWDGNATIRLSHIPETSSMGFQVKTALTFESEPTTIPSIFNPHKVMMLDFVKARIYSHPKTNDVMYYDPGMSKFHMELYLSKRNKLKARVLRGFGGQQRVQARSFA